MRRTFDTSLCIQYARVYVNHGEVHIYKVRWGFSGVELRNGLTDDDRENDDQLGWYELDRIGAFVRVFARQIRKRSTSDSAARSAPKGISFPRFIPLWRFAVSSKTLRDSGMGTRGVSTRRKFVCFKGVPIYYILLLIYKHIYVRIRKRNRNACTGVRFVLKLLQRVNCVGAVYRESRLVVTWSTKLQKASPMLIALESGSTALEEGIRERKNEMGTGRDEDVKKTLRGGSVRWLRSSVF